MKDEALKLALEALEGVVKNCWRDIPSWRLDEIKERITTIKQALAAQPAVQEPVAFKQFLSDVHTAAGLVTHGKQCKALGERLSEGVMRYIATPPAAQPAPVPLTDEQKRELIKESELWDMHIHMGWYSAPSKSFVEKTIQLITTIEAKLKEKNT
jgi:hypothetical protein